MTQGTTPTHVFTLPFSTELIKSARVTYAQKRAVVLIKEDEELIMDGESISVRLTQADTLRFRPDDEVEIQLRILTTAGDALASDIERVSVRRCLDREVLV